MDRTWNGHKYTVMNVLFTNSNVSLEDSGSLRVSWNIARAVWQSGVAEDCAHACESARTKRKYASAHFFPN